MKSTLSSAFILGLSALSAAKNCSYGNLPEELTAVGNPKKTLHVKYALSSWGCAKKSYLAVKPGQRLYSSDTENAPVPDVPSLTPSQNGTGKYVFIMVDPSTNATDPTYPALHTLYVNVTADGAEGWTILAPYINPEPTSGPAHNYSLLLFEQPQAHFEVPSEYASFLPLNLSNLYTRVGFPFLDFINDTGLGKPVAGNWFRESAVTINSTSSSAMPSRSVSLRSVTSTPSASATSIIRNSTATSMLTTGTVSIPWKYPTTSTSAGTGTTTATNPAYTGQAFVSSPGIRDVVLGLGIVAGAFCLF
ncbi:hypothetical protein EYB26_009985 [Talaromyces marneffei]|uniref:uncharacterized protein n=1 Tax=Talaromyces marneffei TaxID=37727 RepID=UPI0012A9B8C8|nr:uncharacterized protein EYB26_009985 [Talaromyces marneffei]QGA22269.1 hypothetical protein EYB26_009985 [Talaromyces marneffei]